MKMLTDGFTTTVIVAVVRREESEMQQFGNGGMLLDTPEEINAFRLLALKGRLKIEVKTGMPFSNHGITTATMVREVIGSKTRSKKKLLGEYEA